MQRCLCPLPTVSVLTTNRVSGLRLLALCVRVLSVCFLVHVCLFFHCLHSHVCLACSSHCDKTIHHGLSSYSLSRFSFLFGHRSQTFNKLLNKHAYMYTEPVATATVTLSLLINMRRLITNCCTQGLVDSKQRPGYHKTEHRGPRR